MSIMAYNGGAVVAMKGKECVAIGTDNRFGIQLQTIGKGAEKIAKFGPKLFMSFPGLVTDSQTVENRLRFRVNSYELRETKEISPKVLGALTTNLLYEHRFGTYFVEPVIAGLDPKTNEPYLCGFDLIGCPNEPEDFVVGGTCEEQLYGMCESLWKPDLGPEDLFEVISQSLVNACDRDAISGWGGTVYVIEKDKVTIRKLRSRMD